MGSYIYKELFDSYEKYSNENNEIWKKLKEELEFEEVVDKVKNLEDFVEGKLGLKIKKELLDKKGYTKMEKDNIVIYIELTNPIKINRFTIAHEIAHIIFDYERLEKGQQIYSDYFENELFHDESEVRANQFAAEFLMPAIFLKDIVSKLFEKKKEKSQGENVVLTIDEVIPLIMEECEVSYSAVENRLRNLGMVS